MPYTESTVFILYKCTATPYTMCTIKRMRLIARRHTQAVRERSAKPRCISSILIGAFLLISNSPLSLLSL